MAQFPKPPHIFAWVPRFPQEKKHNLQTRKYFLISKPLQSHKIGKTQDFELQDFGCESQLHDFVKSMTVYVIYHI